MYLSPAQSALIFQKIIFAVIKKIMEFWSLQNLTRNQFLHKHNILYMNKFVNPPHPLNNIPIM